MSSLSGHTCPILLLLLLNRHHFIFFSVTPPVLISVSAVFSSPNIVILDILAAAFPRANTSSEVMIDDYFTHSPSDCSPVCGCPPSEAPLRACPISHPSMPCHCQQCVSSVLPGDVFLTGLLFLSCESGAQSGHYRWSCLRDMDTFFIFYFFSRCISVMLVYTAHTCGLYTRSQSQGTTQDPGTFVSVEYLCRMTHFIRVLLFNNKANIK